jgi:hypothetical protein
MSRLFLARSRSQANETRAKIASEDVSCQFNFSRQQFRIDCPPSMQEDVTIALLEVVRDKTDEESRRAASNSDNIDV